MTGNRPPGEHWLQLAGRRVRYLVEGSEDPQAPHLTLLHGVGADLESWDEVVANLRDRYRLLRYDLLGHGGSDKPPPPYSMADYVAEVVALLNEVGVSRTSLVGFSFGGMIGQAFAIKHGHRLDRLVLVSAVAGRTDEERARLVARADELERGGATTTVGAAVERWFTPAFRAAHPEVIAERVERLMRNDPTGYAAAYRVFAESDLAPRLHHIEAPTLVITGEHDPGSNVRMARLMRERIPLARIRILPELRHSVLLEAPVLIATLLDDFVQQRLSGEDWDGRGVRPPGCPPPGISSVANGLLAPSP